LKIGVGARTLAIRQRLSCYLQVQPAEGREKERKNLANARRRIKIGARKTLIGLKEHPGLSEKGVMCRCGFCGKPEIIQERESASIFRRSADQKFGKYAPERKDVRSITISSDWRSRERRNLESLLREGEPRKMQQKKGG